MKWKLLLCRFLPYLTMVLSIGIGLGVAITLFFPAIWLAAILACILIFLGIKLL